MIADKRFKLFFAQSLEPPFTDPRTLERVAPLSVDYVNTAGVVEHHLTEEVLRSFVSNLQFVLKPHGRVALDCGPKMPPRKIKGIMEDLGFELVKSVKSIWVDPFLQQVFARSLH